MMSGRETEKKKTVTILCIFLSCKSHKRRENTKETYIKRRFFLHTEKYSFCIISMEDATTKLKTARDIQSFSIFS